MPTTNKIISEDDIYCTICENAEPDAKKVLECENCHVCHHFKCKKIFGNAIQKVRKKDYYCSVVCQEMHLKSVGKAETDGLLIAEFQKVVNEIKDLRNEQNQTRKSLSRAIQEVERSQSFLSEKFEEVCESIKNLKCDQQKLKGTVHFVQENYTTLNETVNRLESDVDRFHRESLSTNAMLLGVPSMKDENIIEIIARFAAAINCDYSGEFITDATRLRDSKTDSRSPPIRIVFATQTSKENFFKKKKEAGQVTVASLGGSYGGLPGRIMLRDEMTPYGLALLREVKEAQEQLNLKFVWPGRDGVILVKKTEKSKLEHIRNRNDLQKLEKPNTKRALDSSILSDLSSSLIEPDPKRTK